ncbi:phage tail protein [Marinobacterium sp. YM272]|uniref:phage tail protein n=1 Tax=Marinobacterium sp. YM272 TaxID=3421654 RepID=UPI003D7FFFC6
MANDYPPVGFHFRVEFDLANAGDADIRFREVSGLQMELEEETVIEGGENRYVQKLPVRAKYPDLVLKRGLITSSAVADWCRAAIQQLDIRPVTVWVTLLNESHEPLQSYVFVNAWPKKWQLSDFNAESSELVVESLELAYQYFEVK